MCNQFRKTIRSTGSIRPYQTFHNVLSNYKQIGFELDTWFCKIPSTPRNAAVGIFLQNVYKSARLHCGIMYPNPFDRKHSTIRQVLDRFFKDSSRVRRKNVLSRKDSNTSSCSTTSSNSERKFFGFGVRS
ncbi:hypothetical protein O3G_MSEX011081 [Manduca sexta]|uniref:Uncharacterized protein n=1 Tax=Manduca sexta TaxID=7130 RepID=A0A921ZK14_MANSE|nr:hypothetical protein O3G_MSEX011081 [Manduca sexta]